MTIHETAAKIAAVNARIADMAQTSNDTCLRLTARIQELEGALNELQMATAHYFRDFTHLHPTISVPLKHARAILAKGN